MVKDLVIKCNIVIAGIFFCIMIVSCEEKVELLQIGKNLNDFQYMTQKAWPLNKVYIENIDMIKNHKNDFVIIEFGSIGFGDYNYIYYDFFTKKVYAYLGGKEKIVTISELDEYGLRSLVDAMTAEASVMDGSYNIDDGSIYIASFLIKGKRFKIGSISLRSDLKEIKIDELNRVLNSVETLKRLYEILIKSTER